MVLLTGRPYKDNHEIHFTRNEYCIGLAKHKFCWNNFVEITSSFLDFKASD